MQGLLKVKELSNQGVSEDTPSHRRYTSTIMKKMQWIFLKKSEKVKTFGKKFPLQWQ